MNGKTLSNSEKSKSPTDVALAAHELALKLPEAERTKVYFLLKGMGLNINNSASTRHSV